jgi:hypothetical protein
VAELVPRKDHCVEQLLDLWVARLGLGQDFADVVLTVFFGAPSMFITLWFGFDYGTNPPLGTLII